MIKDQWIEDEHGEVLCAVLFLTLVMVVLAVVLSSLYLVACCLLIHGARVNKADFLTPWIVITVVVLSLPRRLLPPHPRRQSEQGRLSHPLDRHHCCCPCPQLPAVPQDVCHG